jgi:hypothetical protein
MTMAMVAIVWPSYSSTVAAAAMLE